MPRQSSRVVFSDPGASSGARNLPPNGNPFIIRVHNRGQISSFPWRRSPTWLARLYSPSHGLLPNPSQPLVPSQLVGVADSFQVLALMGLLTSLLHS